MEQSCSSMTILASPFCAILKLKVYFLSLIELVKQPSPSVNPANQLLFKLGKIKLFLIVICSNLILPFVTQILNPLIKRLSFICRVGKTVLPLKILIIISISFLLCVTYLLVFTD
jgi:hypothetical protein